MNATTDYPQLFRQMIVRSTEAALGAIDTQALKLEEEARERSLYALSLALSLAEAWPFSGKLILTLGPYMEMQGFGNDWISYLEKAAIQAREQQDLHSLARLHLQIGRIHGSLDEYATAEENLLEAHRIAVEIADADLQARSLYRLAQTAAEAGDFQRAQSLVKDVLPLVSESSPVKGHCYSIQGLIALRRGDWDAAIPLYQRSLQILSTTGELRFVAQAERTLGLAYRYSKQYEKAIERFERSLEITAALNSLHDYATAQMELGVTYWYLGQHEEALRLYAECEPIFATNQSKIFLGHLYNNRGLALRDLDRTDEAQDSFFASIKIMGELNLPIWVANAMESLGGLYLRIGKVEDAVTTWEQALQELSALPETPRYLYDLLMRRIQEARSVQGEPGAGFP